MKTLKSISILLLLNVVSVSSQVNLNNSTTETKEVIQQIHTKGMNNILDFQPLKQSVGNFAMTQQIGNYNKANVNQMSNAAGNANQALTLQYGSSNEQTIGQIGSGNVLLGFQLGYYSYLFKEGKEDQPGLKIGIANNENNPKIGIDNFVVGERNRLVVNQEGTNNGIMSMQQGSDNTISATQTGRNNYLTALQQGTNNSIDGFTQANNSDKVLSESAVQIGDGLTLKTEGASNSNQNGNQFKQIGTNLTLQFNNDLLNTAGDVEIKQAGKDMKVVVDQSYFSFPMK